MWTKEIKRLREEKGLTQAELGRALGLATSTVGMYEVAKREPPYKTLLKIAKFFKKSPNELLGWKESNPLTPNEQVLIDGFRLLPKKNQLFLRDMISNMLTVTQKKTPATGERKD